MTENTEIVEDSAEETPLDELSKVYDELEAKAETAETEAQAKARDDKGRFASRSVDSEPENPESVVEKPKIDLNQLGYNKDEQEKLSALPEDVLNVLVERNNRFHQGLQPLKQKAEIADSFIGALQPHADYLKALEVAPEDFISSMLATEKTLRLGNEQQKVSLLQRLAHEYQVPLDKVLDTPFDANLMRLQQELEYRDRYINNLKRSQQTNETTQVESYIVQWAQDKEHFDELREPMANLLNAGMATDLDDAYNKAMRLNDGLYEQQQKKQQALLADQKARKALSNSVQVRGNANTGANQPVFNNSLDELHYIANQMGL